MVESESITEQVEPGKLIPYSNNPKKHPEEQVNKLASSIKNYGFRQHIVVDEDYEVIIGHGRLQAAKKLDLDTVPVEVADDLSKAEANQLRVLDNKTAETEYDDEKLARELDKIRNDDAFEQFKESIDEGEMSEYLDSLEENEIEVEKSKEKMPEDLENWNILNLYAGIGGNRRFWPDECNITHVEYNEKIAEALRKIHPEDEVIVGDAHEFLLNNFQDYDFIWSSPPCPTHSQMRKNMNPDDPVYPDMKLYEEILILQGYFEGKWIVENVKSWYNPLIQPQETGRHYYWANFKIADHGELESGTEIGQIDDWDENKSLKKAKQFGLTEKEFEIIPNPSDYPKEKIIRNMVHPDTGEKILKDAFQQKNNDKNIIKNP